jgi:hypothetical protein
MASILNNISRPAGKGWMAGTAVARDDELAVRIFAPLNVKIDDKTVSN